MKKSTPTPKQLLKKHAANNKEFKVARDECSSKLKSEKEIEPFNIQNNYKKKTFTTHDRDLKEDPLRLRNPYAVPDRLRVTTTSLPPRKEKPVPFIMDEIHTICDVDPNFYKIVEGRPIRSFYDIKSYMKDIRDIALTRASAGYLKEEIIQIETFVTFEDEEYEKIDEQFIKVKENFVLFAEDSYEEAKRMQYLAEEKALELATITDKLEGYSFEFAKLKNEFSVIVAIYENLSRYKKFLTNMAPNWWQERYLDMCTMGTSLCSKLFTQLESEETETVTLYKQSTMALAQLQPQLYFRRPRELTTILEVTGKQCLNYMEIDEIFSVSLAKINKHRKEFKESMIDQYRKMQDVIEIFENKVKFMEERRDEYRSAFDKLLENEFYRLVASYDATKLFTCIQYVHSQLFGVKEDPRDNLKSLMLNVERMYYNLCFKLESLNQDVVKVATKQIFNEDIRIMQQARDAQRHMKEYDVLCSSLYRSFEPSRRKTRY